MLQTYSFLLFSRKFFPMLEIGKAVISLDVISANFTCDLKACKGACCVSGDSGAPLEPEEAKILREIFPALKPYLTHESIDTIENFGTSVIDIEGDLVTPLNDGKECAYVIFEEEIAFCAIEKAFNEGVIHFRKPISCHLYPIRIKKYRHIEAVNYDRWEICSPAIVKGNQLQTPVYKFTRDALERKYGKDWFAQLVAIAKNLSIEKS